MPRIGSEFNKLVALERGGQAAIYRGWQESLQRYVALKVYDQKNSDHALAVIQHTRSFSGKTIVDTPAIYDCFLEAKKAWIVMEFIEGLSLDKIKVKNLTEDVKLYIIYKVARIVYNLHSNNLIHGDIKPGNIMITRSGVIKLVDFGMSLDSNVKNQPLTLQGTLSYIAPEKALYGESGKPSIDIFSLGIVLYEMLSGQRPQFNGTELSAPLQWPAHTPECIRELTKDCLAVFPDQRPDSVGKICEVLEHELNNYVNNSYITILSEKIEPLFCHYMAEKCYKAAIALKKKDRLVSYSLLCEAMEWDSDFGPVIKALEEFPSSKDMSGGQNRFLLFSIVAFCGVALCIALFALFFKPEVPPTVLSIPAIERRGEYLDSGVSTRKINDKDIQLMLSSNNTVDSSLLIIRKVPEDVVLFMDRKRIQVDNTESFNLWVSPGDHELLAMNSSDTLFFDFFTILPFEEKKIELDKRKGKMQ